MGSGRTEGAHIGRKNWRHLMTGGSACGRRPPNLRSTRAPYSALPALSAEPRTQASPLRVVPDGLTGPAAALARRTWRPVVAGPERRARKRIGSAKAAFRPYRRPALIERRIAAVLGAVPRVGRAPASAGPRRRAPLRARPALGVSVGEQQSHYCDTEQNKTDRAHGSSPSPSFRSDLRCKKRYSTSDMRIWQRGGLLGWWRRRQTIA
jgi:hypothetical protein